MTAKSTKAATGVPKETAGPRKDPRNRRSPESKLDELKHRLREVSDLGGMGALLGWDQATYMPPAGAAARGRQGATLARIAHEKSTDLALGKLIDDLEPFASVLPSDSDDANLIRVARRDFEKATKVPA